jgi:hypothetical protein
MGKSKQPARAFYTLHELSSMTGIGYRTLLHMAQGDLIPTSKFGVSHTYLVPAVFVDQAVAGTMDHWFEIMRARGLMPAQDAPGPENEENT